MNHFEDILVNVWINRLQNYVAAGTLVCDPNKRNGLVSFEYEQSYIENGWADLDPQNLPTSAKNGMIVCELGNGILPPYFQQFLPGPFAQRHLQDQYPEWHAMTQFERLRTVSKHNSDFYAIQLTGDMFASTNPITSLDKLDELAQVLCGNQRDAKLAASQYLSLCIVPGHRPKLEFGNANSGTRHTVRLPHSDSIEGLALLNVTSEIAKATGIDTCNAELKTLASGSTVLLQNNFHQSFQKYKGKQYTIKYNSVPFSCLLPDDAIHSHRPVYFADAVSIIRKYSAAPDEDLQELVSRNLLSAAINHTANGLEDLHLIDVSVNQWRLAPATNQLPNPQQESLFAMRFSDIEVSGRLINFNEDFAKRLGLSAGIGVTESVQMYHKVLSNLENLKQFHTARRLSAESCALFTKVLHKNKSQGPDVSSGSSGMSP